EDEGYRVTAVGSGADALRLVTDEPPDLTFLDIWMERMGGRETLAEIKRLRPETIVVMISGHGTIETAVKATKLGAYDFIEKPLSLEKTLLVVERTLEHARLEQQHRQLRERVERGQEIVGTSAVIEELRQQIAVAAPTTVRVITDSNQNLQEQIGAGRFREDLFYRLNVIPIEVPALRKRKEDIPALVDHFIALFSAENGRRPKTIAAEALAYFLTNEWPGNVRELRNMVERLVIMAPRDVIGPEDLPPPLRTREEAEAGESPQRDRKLKDAREAFERAYILSELRVHEWNMTRTAEKLGIERSHLYRKLKAYGITPPKS